MEPEVEEPVPEPEPSRDCDWSEGRNPTADERARATELARQAFATLNRGRNAEAVDLATQALELDARNGQAWITLGAGRQARGDSDGGRAAYNCCTELGRGLYVHECRLMLR